MKLLDLLLEEYKHEYTLNLKEGLIKTVPLGKSVSIIKKQFPQLKFRYGNLNPTFTVEINNITVEQYENFLKLINNLGYFISYNKVEGNNISIEDKYNEALIKKMIQNPKVNLITLVCEAKFDFLVDKMPNYLYHIAPLQSWNKIKETGLVPKSRSKSSSHPERVFLTKSVKEAEDLGYKFYQKTGIRDWVLIKIDINLIPGDYFNLYQDPNYLNKGYYTLNNIPPHSINKIKDIKLWKKK